MARKRNRSSGRKGSSSSRPSQTALQSALTATHEQKDDKGGFSLADLDDILGIGKLVGGTITGGVRLAQILAPGKRAGEPSVGEALGGFGKTLAVGLGETLTLPVSIPADLAGNLPGPLGRLPNQIAELMPGRPPGQRLREEGIAPFIVQTAGDAALVGGLITKLPKVSALSKITAPASRTQRVARAASRPYRTAYESQVAPRLAQGSAAVKSARVAEHLASQGYDVNIPLPTRADRLAARLDEARVGGLRLRFGEGRGVTLGGGATRAAVRKGERLGNVEVTNIMQRMRRGMVPIVRHLQGKGLSRVDAERLAYDQLEFLGEIGPLGRTLQGQGSLVPRNLRSGELDALVGKALDEYRGLKAESTARMQASPYMGDRGLENVGSKTPMIPPKVAARVRQLPKVQERTQRLRAELDALTAQRQAAKAAAAGLRQRSVQPVEIPVAWHGADVVETAAIPKRPHAARMMGREEARVRGRADSLARDIRYKGERLRRLEAAESKTWRDLEKALNEPTITKVPAQWQPMWAARNELVKLAETDPQVAAIVADIDLSFPALVAKAEEYGFDPVHFADMTKADVERLVYRTFRLGGRGDAGKARVSKHRSARTMSLRRQAEGKERSIAALVAAHVDTVEEFRNNAVAEWIEANVAWRVPPSMAKPKGWVEYDPVQRGLRRAGEGKPLAPGVQWLIPEAVDITLRKLASQPDNIVAALLRGATHPWRVLVLTLSHTWYLNNAIGNFVLATAQGVRPQDWVRAWRSSRRDAAGMRWADVNIPVGVSDLNMERMSSLVGMETVMGTGGGGMDAIRRNVKAAMEAGGAPEVARYVQSVMVRANEFVDELARSAVFHKTMRETGGKAAAVTDTLGRKRTVYSGGNLEQAIEASYKQLVDYLNLSPVERQYVRTVIPFYAWQKGILVNVANLAVDHPARLRLMMVLNEVNRDLSQDTFGTLPEFYTESLVPFGAGAVGIRSFNPFSDAGSLATKEGLRSSLNPFVELVIRGYMDAPEFLSQGDWQADRFGFSRPTVDIGSGLIDAYMETPAFKYATGDFSGFPLRTSSPERIKELVRRANGTRKQTSSAEALVKLLAM